MRGDPTCRVTSPLGEDFTLRDSAVKREAGGYNLKDNLQTSQIGDLTGSDVSWAVILRESWMVDYTLNGEIKWINAAHNHICTVIFRWWDALAWAGASAQSEHEGRSLRADKCLQLCFVKQKCFHCCKTDSSAQQEAHYSPRHKGDSSDYSISHLAKVPSHRNKLYLFKSVGWKQHNLENRVSVKRWHFSVVSF